MSGTTGAQQYWIGTADDKTANFRRIDPTVAPLPAWLNALGMAGMTAYCALCNTGKPCTGRTVVASGTAGAVDQTIGQIAKNKGWHVVGIAGGPEKCRYVIETLGLDAWIDCKVQPAQDAQQQHCQTGIDVYFDNVGGDMVEAALAYI